MVDGLVGNLAPRYVRAASGLLVFDTLAAIGFAAGLAGSVAAVPLGWTGMAPWLAVLIATSVARGLFAMAAARVGATGARMATTTLRRKIVGRMLRDRMDTRKIQGDWMSTAVDEVDAMDGYVARFLPARFAATFSPLLVLAGAVFASPIAAAILALTLIPFVFALALAGGAAADQSAKQFLALSRLSGLFADRLRAMPLVLAYQAEARQTRALAEAADNLATRTLRVLRVAFVSSAALEFFAALSVALVAVYVGFNLLGLLPFHVPEQLDLAHALFVLALAPEFYAPMRRLAAAYHERQLAEAAAERLAIGPGHTPLIGPNEADWPTIAPPIHFDRVCINYGAQELPAVSSFSLHVPAGTTVALLGPSGSGKTSLLHLLLGLAPLSVGSVAIGNRMLAPGTSIASIASWVGQHPLIVPGTLRENIALADTTASIDRILHAATLAGFTDTLTRRGGLDAIIDARGSGLSGGERRRLALTRALLKPAPVLLLDEPTAHLDAASEDALIATIDALRHTRTILIATHSERLAAIADATVRLGACA